MNETLLIGSIALTIVFSIISLEFRSKYHTFKDTARDFVDTASKLLDIIEDDRITEDEIIHLKYLVVKTRKKLGPLKK